MSMVGAASVNMQGVLGSRASSAPVLMYMYVASLYPETVYAA